MGLSDYKTDELYNELRRRGEYVVFTLNESYVSAADEDIANWAWEHDLMNELLSNWAWESGCSIDMDGDYFNPVEILVQEAESLGYVGMLSDEI